MYQPHLLPLQDQSAFIHLRPRIGDAAAGQNDLLSFMVPLMTTSAVSVLSYIQSCNFCFCIFVKTTDRMQFATSTSPFENDARGSEASFPFAKILPRIPEGSLNNLIDDRGINGWLDKSNRFSAGISKPQSYRITAPSDAVIWNSLFALEKPASPRYLCC